MDTGLFAWYVTVVAVPKWHRHRPTPCTRLSLRSIPDIPLSPRFRPVFPIIGHLICIYSPSIPVSKAQGQSNCSFSSGLGKAGAMMSSHILLHWTASEGPAGAWSSTNRRPSWPRMAWDGFNHLHLLAGRTRGPCWRGWSSWQLSNSLIGVEICLYRMTWQMQTTFFVQHCVPGLYLGCPLPGRRGISPRSCNVWPTSRMLPPGQYQTIMSTMFTDRFCKRTPGWWSRFLLPC